ncbi:MAG: bifunctional nuclease family protein [Chloroflexi bacterium]|nr:bifunctional nuclease family protein [Chloroflexota bacterium]
MPEMVEVVIDSIRVGLMSQQRVVILREVDAERYLAIWIDPYMAEQITFALQEVEVARPMTHDLMRDILRSVDARVVRVEVLSLKGDVFFGNIVVELNKETVNIDSRPSDALALAVRTHVPILISNEVMDAAGIVPEDDMEENGRAGEEGLGEEGEERLEVFEDFLDQLEFDEGDDGENASKKN